ncbi:MAG: 3'-5' exonuclease, partial [Candidatus Verstraetearchaeota archaeon]|nr:3'-5' exonuclease [Candidatus Verstraetearchaeota archaeon]
MPGLESFMPESQNKKRQPDQGRTETRGRGRTGDSRGTGARGRRREGLPEAGLDESSEFEDGSERDSDLDSEPEEPEVGEPEGVEVIQGTRFEAETPSETGSCVLLSISYSGDRGKALVKLYDVERKQIVFWYDNTGHQPYLLTDMPLAEVLGQEDVTTHGGFDRKGCAEVEKYDLLRDRVVRMTRVAAKDPTSIGGRGTGLRDLLAGRSWEDHIRYHECFVYDRRLVPGHYYRIRGGSLVPEEQRVPMDSIREAFPGASTEFLKSVAEWFPIFSSPVPDYRRAAIDIEVETEAQDRIPDPQVAANPVICVSVV